MNDEIQIPEKTVCLDTSVVVGMLSPDEHDESISAMFTKLHHERVLIYGPSLMNFEVLKAIRQQEKDNRIKPDEVVTALKEFSEWPILLVWNQDLVNETLALDRAGIKGVYDASFLALARLKGIPLITEDKQLRKTGRKFHPQVYTTEEWLQRT